MTLHASAGSLCTYERGPASSGPPRYDTVSDEPTHEISAPETFESHQTSPFADISAQTLNDTYSPILSAKGFDTISTLLFLLRVGLISPPWELIYAGNAQSFSSRTGQTSGFPQMISENYFFLLWSFSSRSLQSERG